MIVNIDKENIAALGIDLGTSGVRVVAVNLQGKIVAQATRSYPLLTPHPGWTEQNPNDWIEASFQALTEVVQQLEAYQIVALGLSGQMHGMVPLDATGNVIRPAILWNDQRTEKAVTTIETIVPRHELIQRTGNPAITGFQLPKVVWLRSEEPEAFSRMRYVLLPKDYLGYVLTGEMRTEPSDASGVGCLNLGDRTWDLDILAALDLNAQLFPQIIDSTAIVGKLKPEIAKMTGLPVVPIVAGGGDNAAAAIGLGISSTNCGGSLSLGTSGVIFVPLSQPIAEPEGRVHLFCHADGGYHLLGVTLAAGGSLRWYRDTFFPDSSYDELMQWASHAPAGSGGAIFLPHLAGERSPYLDAQARGAWLNLSLAHSKAEMTRAVLEGVAYSLRAALEVMQAIAPININNLVATGGGSRSALWLQIITDVLNINLAKPIAAEGAAYGAALLALIGCRIYPNLETLFQILPAVEEYTQPNSCSAYTQAFHRFTTIYAALKSIK